MEWKTSPPPVPYEDALAFMEARVEAIHRGEAEECIWLLEHPPLFTAGTSAKQSDLLDSMGFPVYETGRGGQFTYHGPGQRVVYVMVDLRRRCQVSGVRFQGEDDAEDQRLEGSSDRYSSNADTRHLEPKASPSPDLRQYVKDLEHWIIRTLATFSIEGFIRDGRVGVWVETSQKNTNARQESREPSASEASPIAEVSIRREVACAQSEPKRPEQGQTNTEKKIAAIGVRVRHWVTFHGLCINLNPNLSHYAGIVPCGISDYGVTSLADLGVAASMEELDKALKNNCIF